MILVVDDYQDTRELLLLLLSLDGYECAGVDTGTKALECMRHSRPSLVILDFNLPDIDGFSILRHMKVNEELKNIPVIMFSANSFLEEAAKREGVEAFVAKGSLDWYVIRDHVIKFVGPAIPTNSSAEQQAKLRKCE